MRRVASRAVVYDALTCDYGLGARDPRVDAETCLDLNGLLRVEDVDRFIRALITWKADVASIQAVRRGTQSARAQVRETIDAALNRSAGTPNRTERPLSSLGPSDTLRRRCACGVTFNVPPDDRTKQQCTLCAAGMVRA